MSKYGPSYTTRTIRCLEAGENNSSKLTGEDRITLSRIMKASNYTNLSKFLEHKKD